MANIRIPCLVARTNKAGIASFYWQPSAYLARAGWQPMALGKDEGAAIAAARARNAEVAEWKAGGCVRRNLRRHATTGTVAALIARYRRDVMAGFKPDRVTPILRPRTRAVYDTALKRLEAWAGKHPLVHVTPARVRVLRDALAGPAAQGGIGHAAAHNVLRVGRLLFAFAESVDLIPKGSNPFVDFGLAALEPRNQVWEVEDEDAFITAAYQLGFPSMALAIELALYTAQREADLIAFTAPQLQPLALINPILVDHFADGDGRVMAWHLKQQKTKTPLQLALEPPLLAKVEAAIRTNRAADRAATPPRMGLTHVLVNDRTGLPWKQRHFITTWRAIIDQAIANTGRQHMRGLVWHDLRRTRVVRLRRQGMSAEMITTITGHSLKSIDLLLSVYGRIDGNMSAAALAAGARTLPTESPKTPSIGRFSAK